MRNLFLTILSVFILISIGNAQNSSIILGVNGGSNFSKLTGTGDFALSGATYSRKIGFQGGIDVGVKFGDFSFITGLKYVQGGGNTELRRDDPNNPFVFNDGTRDVGVRSTSTSLTSISIPLLLRYQTKGDFAFALSLGPVINSAIGSIKTVETFDLTSGMKGPNEYEDSYGDLGNDFMNSSNLAFMFSPGLLYRLSDNGLLRFNITYMSAGGVNNDNYLIINSFGDAERASGSIGSNSLMFEIGYEHRIDFNIGSQY